jgi:hypothetical protein
MRAYMFYIFGRVGGKVIAQGGFTAESEADSVASSIHDWDDGWEIKRYRTTDLQRAKSMYRAEMSQTMGQLAPSLLPIHKRREKVTDYTKGVYD